VFNSNALASNIYYSKIAMCVEYFLKKICMKSLIGYLCNTKTGKGNSSKSW
jgi:hypothetical protein